MQYREFEDPAIVRGEWMTKIAAEKIEYYQIGLVFFDVYPHLAKPDDEANRPCSMR